MFYHQPSWNSGGDEAPVRALVSLTQAESKRLIAKGIAALPEVRRALEQGIVVIPRGTTNAFVVEEVAGLKVEPKCHFAGGIIVDGELCAIPRGTRMRPIVLRRGKPVDISPTEAFQEFREGDVYIKGASAVDPEGNAGVLVAAEDGAAIGEALRVLLPRGAPIIVPVGLEKLIPSVAQAARATGIFRFKYSTGLPVGLMPIPNALVVTEVQAFQVLSGVEAVPVAGGGIAGSEGAVVLSLEGKAAQIEQAFSLVKSVKGEPPVSRPAVLANQPAADFNYDALAQRQAYYASQGPA